MISRLVAETQELLTLNKALLKALSLKLAALGSLDAPDVAAVGIDHGLVVAVKEEGYLKIAPYHEALGT